MGWTFGRSMLFAASLVNYQVSIAKSRLLSCSSPNKRAPEFAPTEFINQPILNDLMHNNNKKTKLVDMSSAKMKLKLIVDNESTKVVFAEADKEFLDFLLSLLSLPLGTVTLLLKQNDGMVGSLGMLYNSIQSLSESYIQPDLSKEAVLCPKVTIRLAVKHKPLLQCERVAYARKKLYKCPCCRPPKLSDNPQTRCPTCTSATSVELAFLNPAATADYDDSKLYMCGRCKSDYITEIPTECPTPFCRKLMDTVVTFLNPLVVPTEMGGYVKGMVTYMVMDDLVVKLMSTDSIISLLSTFNIKDVGDLKEKTVSIGMAEGLQLLRASLFSKTVLTDAFLSQT